MSQAKMEDIIRLCKRRGFIYQGSDVYGGLSGTWDYGPLGVQLKRNIMNLWWRMFVDERDDMYGVDAAILMNPKVWKASGHVDTFSDPLIDCLECNTRYRTDKLVDDGYQDEVMIMQSNWLGLDNTVAQNIDDLGSLIEYCKKIPNKKTVDEARVILKDIKKNRDLLSKALPDVANAGKYEGIFTAI